MDYIPYKIISGHHSDGLPVTFATRLSIDPSPTRVDIIHDAASIAASSSPATPNHSDLPSSRTHASAPTASFVTAYVSSHHKDHRVRLSPSLIGIIVVAAVAVITTSGVLAFLFIRRRRSNRNYAAINEKQNHEAKELFDARMNDLTDNIGEPMVAAQNSGDYAHPYASDLAVDTVYHGLGRPHDQENDSSTKQADKVDGQRLLTSTPVGP